MGVSNKQIGWNNESGLLKQISKQLQRLISVSASLSRVNLPAASIGPLKRFSNRIKENINLIHTYIPNICYFYDEYRENNYISDGGGDMYDSGNCLNTNLTQLYNDIKDNNVNKSLNIPYTHSQSNSYSDPCTYYEPRMNGKEKDGSAYFGTGSTYLTNMYPGLFILTAENINITEFSITGNLGTDGNATDIIYSDLTNYPGWHMFAKTNKDNDTPGDPGINHIILVYGDVTGVTHLYDNTGSWDDDCLQGLTPVNTKIIYILTATDKNSPVLIEEQLVDLSNVILGMYPTN